MSPELSSKLAALPRRPGVYQHKDENGKVLYVGKAKNLRARVNSYFHTSRNLDGRLRILVDKIRDVEVIETDAEGEALILENNLIKQLRPRYNINLRDDKSYPFICIKNEAFPRVFSTRRVKRDGSKYFGPYTSVRQMNNMLDAIRSIFRLRTCSLRLAPEPIAAGKFDVCLQYHIKKCDAPCVGYQSLESYDSVIRQVEQLLNGKTETLIALLSDEMTRLSEILDYEEAATLRDQVSALKRYAEKQKVVSQDPIDRDMFAVAVDREVNIACGVIFQMREGKIIGRQQKYLHRIEDQSDETIMQVLLERYYTEATFFPHEIILSNECDDLIPVSELLLEQSNHKVTIKAPKRGDKAALARMVHRNAVLVLEEYKLQKERKEEGKIPHAISSLQKDFQLPRLPRRIECIDVSHLGGTGVVASCIVFADGKPKKRDYRTYKVRSVGSGRSDDFQSMREVIARRYMRVVEENGPWPDLLVVDGGKGQLSSAVTALKDVEAYGKFPVVGLAKRLEEVFFPGDQEARFIPKTSSSLQLLQRVRNEAHRFAVEFQRKQRSKKTLHSELLEIPGVGPQTVRKLIRKFGSVHRVKHADVDALLDTVGPAHTERLLAHFKQSIATEIATEELEDNR